MDDRRIKAVLSALRTLRGAAEADPDETFQTGAFNGWVQMLGDLFDEDLGHLEASTDAIAGRSLLTSIDMTIAYAEQMIEQG